MECSGHLHECVLQDPLDTGSTISEPLTFRGGVKFEIIQIKCERAIGSAAYQLTDLLDQRWLAVASETHDLVFIFIHFEAEIRGECGIQHPQGMRKPDFTKAPDCCGTVCHSLAVADRKCGPLAHGVGRHNCGAARWRGEKCGCGVRLMVLGKQDLASGNA